MDRGSLRLDDGRDLEFCVTGPPGAAGLLVFHVGTPSAGVPFPNVTAAAADRGLRTLTYSRPGFGASSRMPNRTVADEAAHVAVLAEHLGAESFFVAGWSGGGPAALACAALLPERVRSCAVLAGRSPFDRVGESWFTGMSEEDCEVYRVVASATAEEAAPLFEEDAAETSAMTAAELETMPWILDVDREAFRMMPELSEALASSMRLATGPGVWGWVDDDLACMRPWGFELHDISVPSTIRHGELDPIVDVSHGRWLAAHIPGAGAEILPGHGHISVAVPFAPVIDALLATAH